MKRCSMCREFKELEEFSKNKNLKDGHQGYCKHCAKIYRNNKGLNSGRKRGRIKKLWKVCRRCKLEKPAEDFQLFYVCKSCIKPRGSKKRFTEEEIKEHQKLSSKRYYRKNKAKKLAYKRTYNKTERGKEKRRCYAKAYRKTQNGSAVDKATHQKRRAQKKTGGIFTAKEWRNLLVKYNYTCLCCGKQEPEIKLTADHIKPLSLGGLNTIDNIQPLCGSCNSSKGAKEIDYRRK